MSNLLKKITTGQLKKAEEKEGKKRNLNTVEYSMKKERKNEHFLKKIDSA